MSRIAPSDDIYGFNISVDFTNDDGTGPIFHDGPFPVGPRSRFKEVVRLAEMYASGFINATMGAMGTNFGTRGYGGEIEIRICGEHDTTIRINGPVFPKGNWNNGDQAEVPLAPTLEDRWLAQFVKSFSSYLTILFRGAHPEFWNGDHNRIFFPGDHGVPLDEVSTDERLEYIGSDKGEIPDLVGSVLETFPGAELVELPGDLPTFVPEDDPARAETATLEPPGETGGRTFICTQCNQELPEEDRCPDYAPDVCIGCTEDPPDDGTNDPTANIPF